MNDAKYCTDLADQDLGGVLREETAGGEARCLATARGSRGQADAEAIKHLADVITTTTGRVP
jgi:hypothetical protein